MFISKHKNRYYYLYYFDQTGKRKSITTGTNSKSKALQFLKNFQEKPTEKKQTPLTWLQLQDVLIRDLQLNNFAVDTVKIYQRVFKLFCRTIGNKHVQLITSEDIQRFKEQRVNEVKTATINIELRTLKAIFNKSKNFIDVNPTLDLKQVRTEQKQIKAFSDTEIEIIRDGLQRDKLILEFFEIGINSGMRLNEIVNLKYSQVNLFERKMEVVNSETFKTKSRKNRAIPINDRLLEILKSKFVNVDGSLKFINQDTYIFSSNGVIHYDKSYITRRFKKHLRHLHLPEHYTFHSTRHYFISKLVSMGADINTVREIAGHSSLTTTQNYMHVRFEQMQKAISKLN